MYFLLSLNLFIKDTKNAKKIFHESNITGRDFKKIHIHGICFWDIQGNHKKNDSLS